MPRLARFRWPLLIVVCLALAVLGVVIIDDFQHPSKPDVKTPENRPAQKTESPPAYMPGTRLIKKTIDLDLADPAKPVDPVIFVEPPDVYRIDVFAQVTGLLRRELYRQAFLLAARNELGLMPRDALLGEEPPDDLPQGNRFRVNPKFFLTQVADVKVECGPVAASRVVWHATGHHLGEPEETHLIALTAAETLSRGEYVTALKRSGMRGDSLRIDPNAQVPAQTEKRLGQMSFTSQYAAMRELHALMREKGESPAILVALSRVYANLAMLTERQWDAMTWVFKARALLHAERLRQREPESPWGHWARGYACAMTGLHKIALDDMAAAEKLRGNLTIPAWVTLADALCRFDSSRLEALMADGPLAETASVFQFLTVENLISSARTLAVGGKTLAKNPECYRVHDAVEELLGVGVPNPAPRGGFEEFSLTFPDRVREMPGLPAAIADKLPPGTPEPEILKALAEAGRSRNEQGEPTWATLGRFARETRANQSLRQLNFVTQRGMSGANTLNKLRPLLADHPLLPFLEHHDNHLVDDWNQYEQRVVKIAIPELTRRHGGVVEKLHQMNQNFGILYHNMAITHGDNTYYDIYLLMGMLKGPGSFSVFAHRLLQVSPYSPMARAALIRDDWKFAQSRAALWESEARDPEVFQALARQSLDSERHADAERQAAEAVRLSPNLESYRLLARARRAGGDDERFVSTMKEFLKVPDQGLSWALAQSEIANHYMARKKFEEARPHAEAAGASGAAWGLECEGRCAEGRGDWELAERLIRSSTANYTNFRNHWYFWCLRTGKGDLKGAEGQADAYLRALGAPKFEGDMLLAGVRQSAAGRPARAAEYFTMAFDRNHLDIFLMIAAAEYDAAAESEKRELAFKKAPTNSTYYSIIPFVRDRLANSQGKPPTREEIEASLKSLPVSARPEADYFIGRFLQNRGQTELASEYFRRCSAHFLPSANVTGVLTALALRQTDKK
ncbi:tetratricopeptide repeat protein [Zavarzinella formosa]|uniref:tetratricopeptide repeat protein n=1 Tax=Zavarzinella formosa TaxID=360055 RepID=UPI00036F2D37|nr:hypothetical protein [Zavarzinella formosa]